MYTIIHENQKIKHKIPAADILRNFTVLEYCSNVLIYTLTIMVLVYLNIFQQCKHYYYINPVPYIFFYLGVPII